jgi:hypothetical protein
MYSIEFSKDDIRAIEFSDYRYNWSNTLQNIGVSEGSNDLNECEAWILADAIEEDTSSGSGTIDIPLAGDMLAAKLWTFVSNIV